MCLCEEQTDAERGLELKIWWTWVPLLVLERGMNVYVSICDSIQHIIVLITTSTRLERENALR